MSRKIFDIIPPFVPEKPREYHHHENKASKEKAKSQKTFMFFLFGVFFIIALFALVKMENGFITSNKSTENTKKTEKTDQSNQFELFNDQGQSTLADQSGLISVRVLNGSGSTTNFTTAKDLLLKAGYKIEKSQKATEDYEQTTIHYKLGQISLAEQVAASLKPNFDPKLEESTDLENTYDLLVIIGNK